MLYSYVGAYLSIVSSGVVQEDDRNSRVVMMGMGRKRLRRRVIRNCILLMKEGLDFPPWLCDWYTLNWLSSSYNNESQTKVSIMGRIFV